MPQNYVPIFIFIAFVVVLLAAHFAGGEAGAPEQSQQDQMMPYECGIDPIDSSRGRYTVRYYIIAILFVVFDVETISCFHGR